MKQQKHKNIRLSLIILLGLAMSVSALATSAAPAAIYGDFTIGANPTLINGDIINTSVGRLYLGANTPAGQKINELTLTGNYMGEDGSQLHASVTANTNVSGKGYLAISGTAGNSGGSTLIVLDLFADWDGSRIDLVEALDAGSDADAFTMNPTTASGSGKTAKLYNESSDDKRIWYICEESVCGTVTLALKVFLQGPTLTSGTAKMTNYIQVPDPLYSRFTEPQLPTENPYNISDVSYSQINNPNGIAGNVVDWILVEIWGEVNMGAATRTLLETQSLLLQPNGNIVNVTGESPKFTPQTVPVRIIIKHRNHLSIMSNEIADFTGEQAYDFTTALTQAYRYSLNNSDPMVLKNGVWCMWAGDLNGDGIVNTSDVTLLDVDFNDSSELRGVYSLSDLTMDGDVNSTDVTIIDYNFNEGARSPVSYFFE